MAKLLLPAGGERVQFRERCFVLTTEPEIDFAARKLSKDFPDDVILSEHVTFGLTIATCST